MKNVNNTIFILDERQRTIGVASNGSPFSLPYYNDLHIEALSGISNYSFTVPATHEEAAKLKINGHIVRQIFDGSYMLFTIKELATGYNSGAREITVFAENTAIGELLQDVKRPSVHTSITLEAMVLDVLSNTYDWTLGDLTYETPQNVEFEDYITVLEALRQIESEFHVEMYFTVELSGNHIVKKKVNFAKERGNKNGVRFEYEHNLQGVSRTEDTSGLITAIVAVGKGDSTKKRVNLTTLPGFDDGDIYKITDADWIGSESALQQWSKDGKHIFGIHIDDEADTDKRLKTIAIRELEKRSVPILHYAATVQRLEELTGYSSKKVGVGDTVLILDRTFSPPIAVESRVKGLEISYTDELSSKVDLGSYKSIALSTPPEIAKIQNAISLKEEEWNTSGITVEIQSYGGNVFRNGMGSTKFLAKVFEKNLEIDQDGTEFLYKWFKFNADGSRVFLWGNGVDYRTGKELHITNLDVDEKATFIVEIEKMTVQT